MAKGTCSIEECQRVQYARGWCRRHYEYWWRHDRTDADVVRPTLEQRFWVKVDKAGPVPDYAPHLGPCWIWTAARNPEGYGNFAVSSADDRNAHRVAYELLVGPIPAGLHLDHLCRVHPCVRPDHLEPVTPAENTRRGDGNGNAVKAFCAKGHEFTPENTYQRTNEGGRGCRACHKEANRRRRRKVSAT